MKENLFKIGFFLAGFLSFQLYYAYSVEIEDKAYVASLIDSQVIVVEDEAYKVIDFEEKLYERSNLNIELPENYEKIAREVLAFIPESQHHSLRKIIADEDKNANRGLASFKSMYLGVNNIENEQEFRRVLIHELGHVLDLGGLRPSKKENDSGFRDGTNVIYASDPSVDFYSLCWTDEYTENDQCGELDFVSEYAQTDAFEDFAESYLLFVENNNAFEQMATESEVIAKKYEFFASVVFNGEFEKTHGVALPKGERVWDLTVIY